MTQLLHRRSDVTVTRSEIFIAARACRHAAGTAIVAHAIDGDVVDHGLVVGVVNDGGIHVVDCAVVGEVIAIPAAADITAANITAAVVHSAIEADVRAPVARMEQIKTGVPTPIPWGP